MKKKIFLSLTTATVLCTLGMVASHGHANMKSLSQTSSDIKTSVNELINNHNPLGSPILGVKNKVDLSNPEGYYFISPDPAHAGDMKITGSCSKVGDYNITAYDSDNHGKLLGDKTHTSIGKFSISTYAPLKQGTKVLLVLRQGDTYLAQAEIIVGEGSEEQIPAPKVAQPIYEGDTIVKGTGHKYGDTIIITNSDGAEIGRGQVGADLKYAVTILPQSAYSTIHVVETDGTLTSPATDVLIHEAHVDIPAPKVDQPVYEGDTLIKGTGHKYGDTIIITNSGGVEIGRGQVGADLKYVVTIPSQSAYSTIHVVETDGTFTSPATDVIVQEAHADIPAPKVDQPVYEGDTLIKGTGHKYGDTIIITTIGGVEIGRGQVGADLKYVVTIPAQSAYSILHVAETDETSTSPATEVIVHEAVHNEDKILSVKDYSISEANATGDAFLYGTYQGNHAARIRIVVEGVESAPIAIEPGNGSFKYWLYDLVSYVGQDVQVQLLDINNGVLDTHQVNIIA